MGAELGKELTTGLASGAGQGRSHRAWQLNGGAGGCAAGAEAHPGVNPL